MYKPSMTLIISLQMKSEDLPIMDRIVRVSGICACGSGIDDGRERQSRHFNTSIFPVGNYRLPLQV
jgi:hypothetical protein